MEKKNTGFDRQQYRKERNQRLVTFETEDINFKLRLYTACCMKRISFNAWMKQYVEPFLEEVMDEQKVPKNMPQFEEGDDMFELARMHAKSVLAMAKEVTHSVRQRRA